MNWRIPHSRPETDAEEVEAVRRVLDRRHPGPGAEVRAFEEELAAFTGARAALCVQSGTAAAHLALVSMGVGTGDRVLIPSYTCAALLHAVRLAGAEPAMADVDAETGNLTAAAAKRAGPVSAAVVPHMCGVPAPVREIQSLRVRVVEDCAMAMGATVGGRPAGGLGPVGIASFYATKMLSTGQGGALFFGDDALAAEARDRAAYDEREDVKLRFNYRMSDLAAAIGRVQLRRLPERATARAACAKRYDDAFRGTPVGPAPSRPGRVYHRYVARIPDGWARVRRGLAERGIESKPAVFRPLHRYVGGSDQEFPGAAAAYGEGLSLPIFPSLGAAEMEETARSAIALSEAKA